jgi:hypothetical protein
MAVTAVSEGWQLRNAHWSLERKLILEPLLFIKFRGNINQGRTNSEFIF